MLESLWLTPAPGAGCVGVFVEPGGVGGQVAFCHSHLVDSSHPKLPQAHEGVWREGGGVFVVWRGASAKTYLASGTVTNSD